MQFKKLLEKWDLNSLKITAGFLEMEWVARDEDKNAAWELYVEMLTRVATQSLLPAQGRERAALESIYSLFPLTREIIKRNGRYSINFTKIAVVVLNQKVRPFTSKWHSKLSQDMCITDDQVLDFRKDLLALQKDLRSYTGLLAQMADVEDLSQMED
jgi:hypothetical protein